MDLHDFQLINTAGWVLVHSVWQLSLIALCYVGVRCLIQRRNVKSRSQILYVAGCSALGAMVLAPVVTFLILPVHQVPVSISNHLASEETGFEGLPGEYVDENVPGSVVGMDEWLVIDEPRHESDSAIADDAPALPFGHLLSYLVVSWLAGVCLFSLRPILGLIHVKALANASEGQDLLGLQEIAKRLSEKLGLRTAVRVAESALVQVPTVVGYFKPIVLMPATALTGLDSDQLKLVLAHELAHIRRHDFLVNLAQTFAETLLFYHPAIWWMSKEVRAHRENCCDDMAVSLSGDRKSMAKALLALEESRVMAPALAANGGSLLVRVSRLLGKPNRYHHAAFTCQNFVLAIVSIGVVIGLPAFENNPTLSAVETQDPVKAIPSSDHQGDQQATSSETMTTEVVALVDGQKILRDEIVAGLVPKRGLPTLEQKVREIVLQNECRRRGITVSQQEIETVLRDKAQRLGLTTQKYVDLIVGKRRITRDKLEKLSELEIILEKLTSDFVSTEIAQEEMRNELEFLFGPKAKVVAFRALDQKVAVRFWRSLNDDPSVAAFSKLAKQLSEDSRDVGIVSIPPVSKRGGSSQLENAAFDLEQGEISPVIQIGDQWYVLLGNGRTKRVVETIPGSQKKAARASILRRRFHEAASERTKRLMHQATILRVCQDAEWDDAFLQIPIQGVEEDLTLVKTYAVADLVVAHHPLLNPSNVDLKGEGAVDFEPLIDLIQQTIDPDSWNNKTIQPYKPHLAIIVSQTRENHAELTNLLAKLRELSDVSIETSSFLTFIPVEEIANVPIRFKDGHESVSRTQVHMLRAFAIAKDSVELQSKPMVSAFNGQRYDMKFENVGSSETCGLSIQQTISFDHQEVRTSLNSSQTQEGLVLSSRSDQFVAVDLTRILGLDAERQRAILVFKSHISEDVD